MPSMDFTVMFVWANLETEHRHQAALHLNLTLSSLTLEESSSYVP